jgi:hypothetical protein
MTKVLIAIIIMLAPGVAWAGDAWIEGYKRSDSSLVQPHFRSIPSYSYNGREATQARRTFRLSPSYGAFGRYNYLTGQFDR